VEEESIRIAHFRSNSQASRTGSGVLGFRVAEASYPELDQSQVTSASSWGRCCSGALINSVGQPFIQATPPVPTVVEERFGRGFCS